MITKEAILNNLQVGSNAIAKEFDALHTEHLIEIAGELAASYDTLQTLLDRGESDPGRMNDQDFQSGLLYWTALNTIFSAIDLLRRGYLKEPQMLMRNAMEVFSAAWDVHVHKEKYEWLITGDKRFDSTDSIIEAKKVHPIIGQWYGMLSDAHTHVGRSHIVPHKVTNGLLAMGGFFNPDDQALATINLLAISLTIDVLDSLLEFTFIKYIPVPRFWNKVDEMNYQYTPNKEKAERLLSKMKPLIDKLND